MLFVFDRILNLSCTRIVSIDTVCSALLFSYSAIFIAASVRNKLIHSFITCSRLRHISACRQCVHVHYICREMYHKPSVNRTMPRPTESAYNAPTGLSITALSEGPGKELYQIQERWWVDRIRDNQPRCTCYCRYLFYYCQYRRCCRHLLCPVTISSA